MPRNILPGVDELERLLHAGETRTSIATIFGVHRTAVSLALTRAGKGPAQVRFIQLLPWRVRQEHLRNYAARMLRLEGRLRNGLKVKDDDLARLASWKQDLADKGDVVIMYFPDHDCPACKGGGGFHPVRRADAIQRFGQPDDRFDTSLIFVTKEQGRDLRG